MGTAREKAWALLKEHVQEEALRKHCLAVEMAMAGYARHFGGDEEYWRVVGLLHDVDYERFPEAHLQHTAEILLPQGYGETLVTDILSHGRDWPRERTLLQKTLLAVDEMTGFVIACALVRPDRSLETLEPKSVLKKMRDKAFAKAVNRETLRASAADLGIELSAHIGHVIAFLAAGCRSEEYRELPLLESRA